jgi:hypothetical protein
MSYRNVFDAIAHEGNDDRYAPRRSETFVPTDAAPGSDEKLALLRRRIVLGQPLWHDLDRHDYDGLTGAVPPRQA